MSELKTEVLVIGAGVVGLAVARRFSLAGLEVLLVERETTFGTQTSSRNSEVIHAGLYYPTGSLKAQLCLDGREKLYEYCERRGVPFAQIGKFVVASSGNESERLLQIHAQAKSNGCSEVRMLTTKEVCDERGELNAESILFSPKTGIIDSHQLMLSLLGDFERAGGTTSWRSDVSQLECSSTGVTARFDDGVEVEAQCIINASGLNAAKLLSPGLASDYGLRLAKGDYFSYAGKVPFTRLVYPVPVPGGLGVHLTMDLGGACRFGPDVSWEETESYEVDGSKADAFFEAIRRYWPKCQRRQLFPAYSGIRPKAIYCDKLIEDFLVLPERTSGSAHVIHLLGIESPGLTSCLTIADYVYDTVH